MRKSGSYWIVVPVALAGLCLSGGAPMFAGDMSFFVSSAGSGKGRDLGGIEGLDAGPGAALSLSELIADYHKTPRDEATAEKALEERFRTS